MAVGLGIIIIAYRLYKEIKSRRVQEYERIRRSAPIFLLAGGIYSITAISFSLRTWQEARDKFCNVVFFFCSCHFHYFAHDSSNGFRGDSSKIYQESYQWGQFGNFGLRLDGLSLPFALIIYILCTVLALYSKPHDT